MQILLPSKKSEANIYILYENSFQIWLSLSVSVSTCVCLGRGQWRRNLALPGLRGNQYCFIDHHFTQGSQWTLYFILCKILIVSGEREG